MTMVLRPVTVRAMRIAPITASEPVLQNATRCMPVKLAISCATSAASGCCGPTSMPARTCARHRGDDQVRLVAEQVRAEAGQQVDVFVAVQVPEPRALGAVDDDRIDQVLPQRIEAGNHARVGHQLAVLLAERLRLRGAPGIPADEGIHPGALRRGEVRPCTSS